MKWKLVFKNCAPFTDCISEIKKNTQVDDAKDNDAVMTMYSLIEYRYGNTIKIN